MNITFNTISIKNFLSFGNVPTTINLNTNKTTLILGNNRDVGDVGESRNGVGKTTIFQALVYALYGEAINNIKQDGLINITNGNNMVVELLFTIDNDIYKIIRGRKPNICEFYKNGKTFTSFSSKTTDESIKTVLGMDMDIFLNTVILTNNLTAFMQMKGAAQKEFLENLFNIKILTERSDRIKVISKENDISIRLSVADLEGKKKLNESKRQTIEKLSHDSEMWISETEKKLESGLAELTKLKAVDINSALALFTASKSTQNEINELVSKHKNHVLVVDNYNRVVKNNKQITENLIELHSKIIEWDINQKTRLNELNSTLEEIQAMNISDAQSVILKLKSLKESELLVDRKIEGLVNKIEVQLGVEKKYEETLFSLKSGECPFCHQTLTHEGHIKEEENKLELVKKVIETLTVSLDLLVQEKETISTEYNTFMLHNPDLLTEKEYLILENETKNILKESSTLKITKNPHIQQRDTQLSQIQDVGVDPNEGYYINDMAASILKLKKTLEEITNKINGLLFKSEKDYLILENNIKNMEETLRVLKEAKNPYVGQLNSIQLVDESDEEIKALQKLELHYKIMVKLLTDSKSYVRRNIISQYVPILNTSINMFLIKLSSPHKVKINDDLSVDIFCGQMMLGGFGSLSNGERLRVNLSIALAFRDFMRSTGRKFDFFGVDELLDSGGDMIFMHNAIYLLKNLSGSVFLISHREELESKCDAIMTIEKFRGFSHVVLGKSGSET